MTLSNLSEPLKTHLPCESCGSSDALAVYPDHTFCFSCGEWKPTGETMEEEHIQQDTNFNFVDHQASFSRKRKLNKETFIKFDSGLGKTSKGDCQVYDYFDNDKNLVAQKIRYKGKKFEILGDFKKVNLFGQHLWPSGGKRVVVTEGEIDAMTISQIQDHKWPVVSVPNGAQGAKKAVAKNVEWLNTFEQVVFCFDNDEQGVKAASECAAILPAGKAKIASTTLKDANEMLVNDKEAELIDILWRARDWRPDGIIDGQDLWETITTTVESESIPYPWLQMNELTHGLRKGELVLIAAGSGVGKSLVCKELGHHLVTNGRKIGYIALEESVRRTALGFMGLHYNEPLHLKTVDDWKEYEEGFKATVGSGNFFCFDHFGSLDSNNLFNKIRYMAVACECDYIFLDHISIVVSGMENGGSDERRAIDRIMTHLRQLVEELGIGMILVSHLRRIDGRSHEEGGKTSLSHLRGSHSLAQLSDMVLGLERDQQGNGDERNITVVRVLKNRYSGQTGVATAVRYTEETGRLTEYDLSGRFDEDEDEIQKQFNS